MTARRAGLLLLVALACRGEPAPRAPAARGGRLAVLAPAAAETLALVGAGDQVVAVGDWVTWPPELAARPRLGAYDAPAAERLLALGVDTLITSSSSAGRRERAEIARLGIAVVELDTDTFAGALDGIAAVGRLVGREAEAGRLLAELRARLDRVAERARDLPRRRTLVVVGRDPLFVAGPGSHLDELVRLAGGENVAADAVTPYAQVALEAVLARRPEVILDSADNRPAAPRGALPGVWARWPFLPAVGAGRVYHLDPAQLAIPGPRLAEMAERVGRMLHPERFGPPGAADFGPPPGGRR